ncbi:DUF6809 family protein [Desulforamulus aquiferis]|uniref:Uncharacterized protein n=1 Tax=Desulforamulus aquiferis TaxID=1397668 RepID=A0AAW7Z8K5_9FIRM|nr:DUF6809 family protein [Desulforamulus aquiferis]MDO7786113.1 hypothetical protein [Desulforamulus aquiferis]
MDRSTTFGQQLYDFIWERYGENFPTLSNSPEYKENNDKAEAALKEITQLLGPEHENLLEIYETARNDCLALSIHQAYLIGFKDGMEFKKIIDLAIR